MHAKLGEIFQKHPEIRNQYIQDQIKEMNSYLNYMRKNGDSRDKNLIFIEWVDNGNSADFSIRWMRIHHILN